MINIHSFPFLSGGTLLKRNGGLVSLLLKHHPTYPWDQQRLYENTKSETYLFKTIQQLFPDQEVHFNFKYYSPKARKLPLEFDVYISSLKLAIEYQGEQHFHQCNMYPSPSVQQRRDIKKRNRCYREGITLIEIPYWWDRTLASIAATIQKHRPELLLWFCNECILIIMVILAIRNRHLHQEEWFGLLSLVLVHTGPVVQE